MIICALFCLGHSKYHTLSRASIDVRTGGPYYFVLMNCLRTSVNVEYMFLELE